MGKSISNLDTLYRDRIHKYLRKEGELHTLEGYMEWEFEQSFKRESKEVQDKVRQRAKEQGVSRYKYVRENVSFLKIIDEFWGSFSEEDFSRSKVVGKGRKVGEAYVGINLKPFAYIGMCVIEVCSGSKGTFVKTYFKKPTKEQLKWDLELGLDDTKLIGNYLGLSIWDIWCELVTAKQIEDREKYVTYTSVLHLKEDTSKHRVGEEVFLQIKGVDSRFTGKYRRVKKETAVDWGLNGWKKIDGVERGV